ncbi:MAG TPA: hypothetical protein PLM53_07530 [Spirochaetota bacterium]|nr:hypothetical protein [Spirochaetota bacterium]HPC41206.1 hypothetical protein [Spirochaetota bacterium]HPL17481.1 hypothetical protein [Spirochaetota bacterium]HQF08182.1 hypothetical protein [Spirochaetota bacterium]HQH96931.1 hypothetical protein [Spirochaetota bacterium]
MKIMIGTVLFLCAAAFPYAGTSPEAFLAQIPAVPGNCCGIIEKEKNSFKKSVSDLDEKMEKEFRERNRECKAYMEKNREAIASKMITLPDGVDVKEKKNKKMTKEEKKAMAEKMMREYGLSPDDPKRLKGMTKEERIEWAETYVSGADKKLKDDQKHQEARKGARENLGLLQEQQALLAKINNRMAGFDNKFKDLERMADALEKKELEPLRKKLASYGEIRTSKEQELRAMQDGKQLDAAKQRYCETMSPRYRALLAEYLAAVKACLPDYKRLEVITARIQMGLDKPIEAADGLMTIEPLRKYLDLLGDVYKFDLLNRQ